MIQTRILRMIVLWQRLLEEACDVLGNLDGHRDAAYHEEGIAIIRHGDVKYQCNDETYEEKAVEQVAEFVSFHTSVE